MFVLQQRSIYTQSRVIQIGYLDSLSVVQYFTPLLQMQHAGTRSCSLELYAEYLCLERAWDVKTGQPICIYEGHFASVTCLDITERFLFTGKESCCLLC
jgi:hypothetical protein